MLFRYPGSKTKHTKFLTPLFPEQPFALCEPFAGAAAVSFKLLEEKRLAKLHLSDIDKGITDLWSVVKDEPQFLVKRVTSFVPSVDQFVELKTTTPHEPLDVAFRKLALHQMSYSGLGVMSGPIGGYAQKGAYKVDCRWNPVRLSNTIYKASALLNSVPVTISHNSVFDVLDQDAFLYLDPPYFKQGKTLYQYGEFDHTRLAHELHHKTNWVLSYDNCGEVRDLYSWASIKEVDVTSHMHHKDIKDVIITP